MPLLRSPRGPETDRIRVDLEAYLSYSVTSLQPIREGHSGFTYDVVTAAGPFVLRVPPPGARIAGPADVIRQGRIMAALNRSGLPVPAVPVICERPLVDGRPFIMMETVQGIRIEQAMLTAPAVDIARSAIAILGQIQAVPISESGIGDEEPVGLTAEIARWAWLMQRAPTPLSIRAHHLQHALADRLPTERSPTLVHGDYHFGNLLFRDSQVVGVLDWEIAEIGQPLLDLGCLAIGANTDSFEGGPHPAGGLDLPFETLLKLYGAEPGEMDWYLALTYYKYAAIFGYNLMLHRRGKRLDPMYEQLTATIVRLIDDGLLIIS